jgi:hypothetical protein
MEWACILAYITGTVDQELLLRNEYLAAENRILKAQLQGRLRLSDAERMTLGEVGHRLGRKALGPEQAASSRMTEQAFQNYLAVMMVSLLALFPGISTRTFGSVTLIATASWSLFVVIRFYRTITQRLERRLWIYAMRRHISSLIGFGILLGSALCMSLKWGEVYNWFAASTLVLLFSATAVSWELLRRIANQSPG